MVELTWNDPTTTTTTTTTIAIGIIVLFLCIDFFSANRDKVLYMELAHGGHLGFYEGGFIYPNPVAWLDRTLVALVGSLVYVHNNLKDKSVGC